jgi:GTPase Era involved in 16S rRNA processing
MTPKEKAEELIRKFVEPTTKFNTINGVGYYQDRVAAKQCALTAADEIKEQLIENLDNEISTIHAIYWEKVKQEIEKL